MFCNRVEIKNFRNSEHAEVEFTDGVNVLLGSNAQGKTNLLEAVYIACTAKSFRAANDSQLIRFGSDFASVSVDFTDSRKQNISFSYEQGKRRKIEINKNNNVFKIAPMITYHIEILEKINTNATPYQNNISPK